MIGKAVSASSRSMKRIGLEPVHWFADLVGEPSPNGEIKWLTPGWRLVSLHGVKPNTEINQAFLHYALVSIVLTYDPRVPGAWLSASRGEDDLLVGSLERIDPQLGYFVFADQMDVNQQFTLGHANNEIQFDFEPLTPGWNLVSGWVLVSKHRSSIEIELDSVFADDSVRTVVAYKPPSSGTGLRGWIDRRSKLLDFIICGESAVEDGFLTATRGDDGKFTGNLKTIRPELGYWVYRELSESE